MFTEKKNDVSVCFFRVLLLLVANVSRVMAADPTVQNGQRITSNNNTALPTQALSGAIFAWQFGRNLLFFRFRTNKFVEFFFFSSRVRSGP